MSETKGGRFRCRVRKVIGLQFRFAGSRFLGLRAGWQPRCRDVQGTMGFALGGFGGSRTEG